MYGQPFARYSLSTRSNRQPSTRDTVVSGPTKTSAQTTAVACAPRWRQPPPPTGARPVRLTSYAEPTREAHR
jgi:hypothetical protein